MTGVLQSTLGNLPEFFIVLFALSAGELVVARTSILGSIFANALLVLGIVLLAGCHASEDGVMRFHTRLPKDNAVLLLLTSFLIVLIGLSVATDDNASTHVTAISVVGAVALLVTYGVWLYDYLRSDMPREGGAAQRVSLTLAFALLAAGGVGAAFVSDWFIAALEPAIEALHLSQAFTGLVIVAIAGNAVENVVGIQLAAANKPDYAISVILNSSLQVALFLTPALVLLSLVVGGAYLTLVMPPMLVVAVGLAALLGALIVFDGESTWLEGMALLGLYAILAASFWWG